ncbi:MAG: Mobile element protein [Edaphobacter sp.]|nr:Mobile element protein [Edaphobacter sp.]
MHQLSQRRVARLIPIERMTLRYTHHRDPQEALRVRLRELAGSRVRYGYRRLTVLLRREGWPVNAKRIYRLYLEEGLIVRTQKRRERAQRQRLPLGRAARRNQHDHRPTETPQKLPQHDRGDGHPGCNARHPLCMGP